MIVRILSEGQYRVDGEALSLIKTLDDQIMAAITNEQPDEFHRLFAHLVDTVRSGEALPPTHLGESDLILPAADLSFAEAKRLFQDNPLSI